LSEPSRARVLVGATAFALIGVTELAHRLLGFLVPGEIGNCSVDIFGLQFPPATHCYVPIGDTLVTAAAAVVIAIAYAARPQLVAPIAAFAVVLHAALSAMSVLPEDGPLNVATLRLSLLAATLFLVVVPSGPTANRWARRAWILVLVACAVLVAFDTMFSGFMRMDPPGFQFAFVVVGLAVLGAGWLAGRLEGRAAVPAGT